MKTKDLHREAVAVFFLKGTIYKAGDHLGISFGTLYGRMRTGLRNMATDMGYDPKKDKDIFAPLDSPTKNMKASRIVWENYREWLEDKHNHAARKERMKKQMTSTNAPTLFDNEYNQQPEQTEENHPEQEEQQAAPEPEESEAEEAAAEKKWDEELLAEAREKAEEMSNDIEQRANYLRIAMNLQKIGIDVEMAERIIVTYEGVLKKGGKFTIKDAVEIDMQLERKFTEKKLRKKQDEAA